MTSPCSNTDDAKDDYIPFASASAGQQATALLQVLLNQDGPPLIIDQPEDDLDNQVIFDIVEQLWSARSRRQIIFSSHNANLVVNGDADLVVCCDYRRAGDHSGGQIKYRGAIDVQEIREEIKRVMEGGERAFQLRKAKYGF
jgi:chromosome segregation protein